MGGAGDGVLLLVVAVGFVGGYFLISKLVDWQRRRHAIPADLPPPSPGPGLAVAGIGPVREAAGDQTREQACWFHLYSMIGKMAGVDGMISADEIAVAGRFASERLRVEETVRARLIEVVRSAAKSDTPLEHHAREYMALYAPPMPAPAEVLGLLRTLAQADGRFSGDEKLLLDRAGAILSP